MKHPFRCTSNQAPKDRMRNIKTCVQRYHVLLNSLSTILGSSVCRQTTLLHGFVEKVHLRNIKQES
jgi:hypothetical protein